MVSQVIQNPTQSSTGVGLVLIFALLLLAAVASGAVLLISRRRGKRMGDPSCKHCGYIVTGLTTFICPECGSDLRQVGIQGAIPAGLKQLPTHSGLILRLCLLGVGVILAGAVAHGLIFYDAWPFPINSLYKLDMDTSGKRPYDKVTINYTAKGISYRGADDFNARRAIPVALDQWPSRKAELRFSFARLQPIVLTADFRADQMSYQYETPDGTMASGSGGINAATILRAFKAAQIDTGKMHVDDDAQSLANALAAMGNIAPDTIASLSPTFPQQCLFQSNESMVGYTASSGVMADAMPGLSEATLICCTFVWLVGAIPLLIRYRRRTAEQVAREEKSSTAIDSSPTARTLTVMFSDIQNYTASTASSHRMAPLDLARRHRDAVAPVAGRRGGRIVKSLGDGLLVTFDSATDAVCAGVEIQSAVTEMNRGFSDSPQLAIRIGIATGEAVLCDGDIFGQVVNVAARLQQSAGTGEVVFSESTRAIINREEVRFEELGERELKGVGMPVKVFRAVVESS